MVKASLDQGRPTFVLQRPEIGLDIEKLQMLLSFKAKGATLVEGSFADHKSLVEAVKKVDVVICTMSGVHFRSHNILLQLKLVEAIKEAGNIHIRFLPSEFGMDPARMGDALEPGRVTFDEKMIVRKAIEEVNIPHTYLAALTPPKEKVCLYGDGNVKAVFVDEYDIATYTIKTIDDPRTLNKTVYMRPPENILSQRQIVEIWEKLTGKKLDKFSISKEDFLASMEGKDFTFQVGVGHFYHIYYDGCLTKFKIGEEGEEAATLYPEVNYKRMDDYV
ncbi:hypothetical protein PVL29_002451 [Vitis rotundifolia]|uniref:NmrA-like domain-containing protein n=1 Tax=Vitis rotundifolia TaxID=103349 RepID=A0AA39AH10_VITRO|nr:hypothetical protein PVL29_002451 [Vitis rotundifolia]